MDSSDRVHHLGLWQIYNGKINVLIIKLTIREQREKFLFFTFTKTPFRTFWTAMTVRTCISFVLVTLIGANSRHVKTSYSLFTTVNGLEHGGRIYDRSTEHGVTRVHACISSDPNTVYQMYFWHGCVVKWPQSNVQLVINVFMTNNIRLSSQISRRCPLT